jgi:hypothetical protein
MQNEETNEQTDPAGTLCRFIAAAPGADFPPPFSIFPRLEMRCASWPGASSLDRALYTACWRLVGIAAALWSGGVMLLPIPSVFPRL